MSEVQNLGGMGGVSPSDRKIYEQEYQQGADLFQKALQQSSKSENPYQREEFNQVMQQAMQILNESAQQLKRADLEQQNQKISHDYQTYRQAPSQETLTKLDQALTNARKSVG